MRRLAVVLLFLALTLPLHAQKPPQGGPVEQIVQITSEPAGAAVYGDNYDPGTDSGRIGTTPVDYPLDTRFSHKITFVLDGYTTVAKTLKEGETSVSAILQPSNPWTWIRDSVKSHPVIYATALAAVLALVAFVIVKLRRRLKQIAPAPVVDESRIGDYQIVDSLGEGAFSRVYRARHAQFGDVYALKVMKKDTLDKDAMSRLGREMEIGRDLLHPSLVRVFAFGEVNGAPYLVMELVDGDTLEKRLDGGPLPLAQALDIAAEVCAGLIYTHQRSIIHRDLKPANIVLTAEGRVRVLDFGIARCLDMQKLTMTGVPLGTPAYMAPEAPRSKVDARSDIYSLGVVMYEMLCGTTPFQADDAISMIMAHVSEKVPSLRERAPNVPAEVEAVVLRMLAKKPARRYQTMQEVLEALEALRATTKIGEG